MLKEFSPRKSGGIQPLHGRLGLQSVGKRHGGQSGDPPVGRSILKTMGKALVKKVEIGGVEIVLHSFDGVNWSTSLTDLERFKAGRKATQVLTQKAFSRIGANPYWGLSRKRRHSH
jgi:hypothetical protein